MFLLIYCLILVGLEIYEFPAVYTEETQQNTKRQKNTLNR